jgi:hypothetical protein
MDDWEREQRDLAEDAVRAVLPAETADAVVGCEAFGAVAGKLYRAEQAGADREQVLAQLDPDDVDYIPNADRPAAFRASRIHH